MEAQHKSPWIIDSFTELETRRELAKRATLLSIEEFKAAREQGTVLYPEPVTEPQPAENLTDKPVLVSPSQEQPDIDDVPSNIASDLPTLSDTPSELSNRLPDPMIPPKISEPHQPEPGHTSMEQAS